MTEQGAVTGGVGRGWSHRLAWGLVLVGAVAWMLAVVWGLARPAGQEPLAVSDVVWALSFVGFLVVGGLIADRHPANPIGWCFVVGVVAIAGGVATAEYATVPSRPGVGWVAVAGAVSFAGGAPLLTGIWLTLFPDGRPVSPRWRWLWVALVAAGLVFAFGQSLVPLVGNGGVEVARPSVLLGHERLGATMSAIGGTGLLVLSLVAVGTLVLRYRRGTALMRAQLRWLLLVAAIVVVLAGVTFSSDLALGPDAAVVSLLGYVTFVTATVGLSAGVAIAIGRHRLYEIDRVISRTVAYAVLTVLLVGLYVAVVLTLETLVRPLVGSSHDLVVAVSTLAVAAAFRPVRRRVQTVVDRRFDRRRVDAAATVEAFARRLRDELDLGAATEDLRRSVDEALAPAHVGILFFGPRS
jgi:hypothetical protein